MRLLTATALSLTASLFAFSAAVTPADAKPRRKPAAVKVAAKPAPAPVNAVIETGFNPDGSIHAPVIEDAPADDYQRVAWCHGILSGNMELAKQVDPVLPVDETLQTIGKSYLRAYEAALTLSGKGATPAGHAQAEKARQLGYDAWKGARASELPKAAGAHATWQLPGDCEHAAVRLSGHPNLFAEMATDAELDAIEAVMTSGGPHDYNELPKPVLTAETVDHADPDAPIATNTLARRATQSQSLPKLPDTKPESR
ncbi:hypothetical protein ABI_12430 [Asticcacaulis biprosthecium C19]|uniref:Uncharacterized protein n=1 Tax=Asticcacaulis biprosthecium C19 TaxID=715226 RepID=F4QHR8_9CAUL|nr:hypothetical protein [Asticcacaulis biprosthecium]EGF92805.1 hypothetical protein ABI_12430 [Asticcacaulis biprosthecium C19]